MSRRIWYVVFGAAVLFFWSRGSAELISEAHAGTLPSSSLGTTATPTATPSPKLSSAIYTTLPGVNTVAVYPIASKGNVPSLVGNTFISNPGGIGYWAGRLYVTNLATDSITVYPAGADGSTNPIVTIRGENTLLDSPTAIAFDSAGNIFVANAGSRSGGHDRVTKYSAGASGDVSPVAVIAGPQTKLFQPDALSVDSSGNIYVANQGSIVKALDSITVYSPGSTGNIAPARTISGDRTRLSSLSGVAVDSSGNIYASSFGVEGSQGAGILIFAAGSNGNVAPTMSIDGDCANLTTTGPIALDASANLYVGGYDKIVFFAHEKLFPQLGGVQCLTPAFQISGPQTGIKEITGIAVDSVGDIFVADSESTGVGVFQSGDSGDVEPSATIATHNDIFAPTGVALDSSGKIYVVNGAADRRVSNTITIYAPGSNAATAPIASIGYDYEHGITDKADLNSPFAIAIDKEDKVYVANQADGYDSDGSITIYSARSTGNVEPIAKISGGKTRDSTGLNSPIGLAVDAADKLYVLNEFGGPEQTGSITIYPPGASGDVAPEAAIADSATSKHTQLNSPAGLALDSAGNIYVTNDGTDSITIYGAGSKGAVAPKATISGSNTGLMMPRGIAIDSDGNIYVANAADGIVDDESEGENYGSHNSPATITVYPRGSSGNIKPIATISGSLTSLAHPEGIAIGPAILTTPPPRSLAAYDWSVTASPNLAANPPSKEVVERFILSIRTSAKGSLGLSGGPEKLRSFQFANLRHDGFLSLVAGTDMGGTASCNDYHHPVFCSVYLVDTTKTGFEVYKNYGSIDAGGTVPLGIQDLRHDGNLQLIVNQPFASIWKQCTASWPAIYAWTGDGYKNVSDRFKDFYRQQLDALTKTFSALPPTGPSYDQRDKECLQAEAAKTERLLGISPNAGLETAIAFANSRDRAKIAFGIFELVSIDTPQAQQYLNTLPNSRNPEVRQMAKQWFDARSRGMDKLLREFERLR